MEEKHSDDIRRSREHDARIKCQSLKYETSEVEKRVLHLTGQVSMCREAEQKSRSNADECKPDREENARREESGDGDKDHRSVEEVRSKIDAAEAEENLHRDELRDLKRKMGKSGKNVGRANVINRGTIKTKASAVELLQSRMRGIFEGIECLEKGADDAVGLMKSVNQACFKQVRTTFETHVSSLLPGKVGRLELVRGNELEGGIALTVATMTSAPSLEPHSDDEPRKQDEQKRSVSELSGGEKALVGLALTCALASFKRAPLYLLDEIDAPMDEHNQERAAAAVKACFGGSQVLCVSHHAALQRNADQMLQIARDKGESSKFLRCVPNIE